MVRGPSDFLSYPTSLSKTLFPSPPFLILTTLLVPVLRVLAGIACLLRFFVKRDFLAGLFIARLGAGRGFWLGLKNITEEPGVTGCLGAGEYFGGADLGSAAWWTVSGRRPPSPPIYFFAHRKPAAMVSFSALRRIFHTPITFKSDKNSQT